MEQPSGRIDPASEEERERVSVFRTKSIDRISSPDQLNEYIRVASLRTWIVLGAVLVFLAGAVIWAVFGRIESTVHGVCIVDGESCTLYVCEEKAALLQAGDTAHVDREETAVLSVSPEPVAVSDAFPEYARSVGGFAVGEWVRAAEVASVHLQDGIYPASVIEESLSPISLLTDKN